MADSYVNRFITTIDPLIRNFTSPLGFKLRQFVTMDYFKGLEHAKRQDGIGEAYYETSEKVVFSQVSGDTRYIERVKLINNVKVTDADANKADRELEADITRRTQDLVDTLGLLEDEFILSKIAGENKTASNPAATLGDSETIKYDYLAEADNQGAAALHKDLAVKYGLNAAKVIGATTMLVEKGHKGPFVCVPSHYSYQIFRNDSIVQSWLTSNVKSMAQDVFSWDRVSAFVPLRGVPSEINVQRMINGDPNAHVDIQYAYVFSQSNIILNEFSPYKTEIHPVWDEAGSKAIKMFATLGASRLEESGVARIECVSRFY